MVFATAQSEADVDRLAEELVSPWRRRPHCVVTTRAGSEAPAFDAAGLAADCGEAADVTVIRTGSLTWRLSERLPELCGVYGGASRVYPTGTAWQTAPLLSPLRFLYDPADAPRARQRLLEDALTMAAATAGADRARPPAATSRARVQGFLAGATRALVRTDDDAAATISADLTLPGIPLDWYLTEGAVVEGRLRGSGLFEIALTPLDARAALDRFGDGTVTVALVRSVARQEAQLLLHPRVAVRITRSDISSNPRDLVSNLLGVGEVVPVRVVRSAQGRLALRLDDIEDEEDPQAAVPLIDGGSPWLVAGRDLGTEPVLTDLAIADPEPDGAAQPPAATQPGPDLGASGPGAAPTVAAQPRSLVRQLQGQVEMLKRENARLRPFETAADDLGALRLELGQERARVRELQDQLRGERRAASDLRKMARADVSTRQSPLDSRDRFDDVDDWIRHEVYLAWIERLPSADRRRRPLPDDWSVGPEFGTSLTDLTGSTLRKTFRTVVDVMTGRAEDLDGRMLHQLRNGVGGDDPPVVRARDGASCWRVAVERNTPSARRLHYWRTPGGIELSRVVQHDDYRP